MALEPLSPAEAYLAVTANRPGLPTAWTSAKAIRARTVAETSLTASAGVSHNTFMAKLALGQRKPNGQFMVAGSPPEGTPDSDRSNDVLSLGGQLPRRGVTLTAIRNAREQTLGRPVQG